MNINQFLELIGRKKQTIVSLVVIFLAVAIVFSAIQPFKYDSNMKLLVIIGFKQDIDPYTASRSNQYLSGLLANIVSSGSFFEQIKQSGFKIDNNYFSGTTKEQMKKWRQTVSAKSMTDTGTITLDVYHPDRAQAEEIVKAVTYTLQTTNSQYHGFGNSVEIKTIDQPTTSNYPVKPNLLLNLALAVIFALFFSICYIYLFPEEKYNLRLWPKKQGRAYTEIEFNEPSAAPVVACEPIFAEVEADDEPVYANDSNYAEAINEKTADESAFAKASSEAVATADKPETDGYVSAYTETPSFTKAVDDKPADEPAFVSLIPERAEADLTETPSRTETVENNSSHISTSYNPADYQVSGSMNNVFKR
jgi:capsular polysaccharide biosynthesis protein